MYKIYGDNQNAIVWDATLNKPLGQFKDGVYETEDESIAKKFKTLGYKVEGTKAVQQQAPKVAQQ